MADGIYQPDECYGLNQSVAPTEEPITIDEVRQWGDVQTGMEDMQIKSMISKARAMAELYTRRQICTATWVMYLDRFPNQSETRPYGEIIMTKAPVASVTSLVYVSTAGVSTTLTATTDYQVDIYRRRVAPAYNTAWPSPRIQPNAVTLTYVAGQAASAVPDSLKVAIKIMVLDMLENRGGVFRTPPGAQEILDQFWTGVY
jgi:uncharacterized phiE125 gp8 family phage protein